jgi:hypothetical protein
LSIQTVELRGASKDGFLSQDEVRQRARELSLEAFREAYPAPALMVVDVTVGAGGGDADATVKSGPQLVTMLSQGANAFRYLDRVGFLVKRPGNPFPQFVSLGRAGNNDLVLAVESVSKFHAYFTCDGGRWSLTDYRSMNGTSLNGERVEPNATRPLADGAEIEFGGQIKLRFLTTDWLYKKLRG